MEKRRDLARSMRKQPPEAEAFAWSRLRNRRFHEFKFRRQVPIGNFVVDFLCLDRRLIIELDGGQHTLRRSEDQARTAWLESQGFRVIRFWNFEVLDDWDTVAEVIWNALQSAKPNGE
ncbi:MAG: endonuclease domain-containing protein [Planctomycetaceae bacterium]